jgi:hypothetical protein
MFEKLLFSIRNQQQMMTVLWVVAPCSLFEVYQRFRGSSGLHHKKTVIFMISAVRTSNLANKTKLFSQKMKN